MGIRTKRFVNYFSLQRGFNSIAAWLSHLQRFCCRNWSLCRCFGERWKYLIPPAVKFQLMVGGVLAWRWMNFTY